MGFTTKYGIGAPPESKIGVNVTLAVMRIDSPGAKPDGAAGRETVDVVDTIPTKVGPSGLGSQTSPMPSPSRSDWSGLATSGQLSRSSGIPSPS